METQLLHEFVLLSKTLNFSKAAQKMNITQPVLSRHMKYLEEYFGASFFKRDTHKVELTTAGKLFTEEAGKILLQYETSISAIHSFTGKSRRRLAVTFLGEAIQKFLITFLTQFRATHSDILIECRDSELDEALALLDNHASDMGFLIRPNFMANESRFCTLPFQTDPLCAVVNKCHPLAGRGSVSLREVSEWPIMRIDPREFSLSDEYSTRFLTIRNIDFTLDKEYPNLKTCCFNLEFSDRAVLLMPRHRGYLTGQNCVMLDIAEQDCWFNLELVWDSKNTNPSVAIFLKEFKSFLKQ
ncbi:LysR family transcriptional regulator [Sodalis sp. RH20]|uniref:LysR family transcriptional regulator n=1 Tax=unclassified Sodalis (in: enterobacteria) TaxID=2636512 RepID=UPI0039B4FF3F